MFRCDFNISFFFLNSRSKQTHNVTAAPNRPAPQNVGQAVLNIAPAMTSLDTDEAVIYCVWLLFIFIK